VKDLGSHTIISIYSVTCFEARFLLWQSPLLHDFVGAQLIDEVKAVFALA
jgi:hypothetical protein